MTAAAPRERQVHQREPACAQRQTNGDAVAELARSQTDAFRGDLPLLEQQIGPDRSPDRVLNALLQREEIRPAELVVVVRAEEALAIDVGAAQRRLKVKRHLAAGETGIWRHGAAPRSF